jgi:hypothetical protein
MKTNLLAPEFEVRPRSNLTPDGNHLTKLAFPSDERSETRLGQVLRPLDELSRTSQHLYSSRILTGGHRHISRYLFEGDQLREPPIRIGIFAGLCGDNEVGPEAVSTFLADLVALPHLGNGLRIYAYPIVSALDIESTTPAARRSRYTINQIGGQRLASEIYQIEREIFAIGFDGIVTIQLEEKINNLNLSISDASLHDTLVLPILSALEPFLPDIEDCDWDSRRSLTAGVRLQKSPFELTLRVPSSGWSGLYAMGLRIALHTAVDCYRSYLTQDKRSSGWLINNLLQTI